MVPGRCDEAIKPIIFQKRRDYQFVPMDSPDDEAVFSRKQFRYGVDARVNVGFGLWQLAYASKQALDVTTFGAAYAALMSIKGDNDKPLGIMRPFWWSRRRCATRADRR